MKTRYVSIRKGFFVGEIVFEHRVRIGETMYYYNNPTSYYLDSITLFNGRPVYSFRNLTRVYVDDTDRYIENGLAYIDKSL